MKKFLATTGVALLMIAPAAAYAADTAPEIKAEVTSASRQTSSEVNVAGTWSTEKLAVGQSFTVASKDGGFKWNASFPFALNDGTVVGECTADQATLTCKVNEVPDAYKDKTDVKGTWWARARLQDKAVGTNEGTITLNGEVVWGDAEGSGVCTNDCGSATHYEYARPENIKFGWTNDNAIIGWGIKFIAEGGVEYTVKDFDTRLSTYVKCTKGDTWDPATTVEVTATQVDDNTIRFTAPEGVKVCITYPPEQVRVSDGQTSVTNHAEVNGMKLEATATVRSNGGTDGNGSVKPTPAPEPSTPSVTPTPEPSKTTPVPVPPIAQASEPGGKLAKTGAASEAAVIAILTLLIGAAVTTVAWCVGRFGNDHI